MLYLLKSPYSDDTDSLEFIYKVGYADDLDFRFGQYVSHNPGIKLIDSREGSLLDESLMHLYLHSFGLSKLRNEWYIYDPRVPEYFKEPFDTIKNYIWSNRETLLKDTGAPRFIEMYTNLQKTICPDFLDQDYTKLNKLDRYYFNRLEIDSLDSVKPDDYKDPQEIMRLIKVLRDRTEYRVKMLKICKYLIDNPGIELSFLPRMFSSYINLLGPSRIYALRGEQKVLDNEINSRENIQNIDDIIYSSFQEGSRYTKSDIKETLKKIYSDNGISKTAKATDINSWYSTKTILILNSETGKKDHGFTLIKKLK